MAERVAVLLIGLPGCGVAALRRGLEAGRAPLRARGVGLPALGQAPGRRLREILGAASPPDAAGDPEAWLERWRTALLDPLGDPALSRVVIAAEALSGLRARHVRRLSDMLAENGLTPRVVAYVPRPADYAADRVLRRVRAGAPLARAMERPPLPRYRRRLRPWRRALGAEALELRLLDLPRGPAALTADFLSLLDAGDLSLPAPPRAARLSAAGLRLIDLINRAEEGLWPGLARRLPAAALARALPGPPARLPPITAARVTEESAADLDWLARLLGREPFPDLAPAPPPGPYDTDAPAY